LQIKSAPFLEDFDFKSAHLIFLNPAVTEHYRCNRKPDDQNLWFSLSRWRERGWVRVVSNYIPLTLIFFPRVEEIRRCAVLK